MPYRRSEPLQRWLGERSTVLSLLATAHVSAAAAPGAGRPRDASKALARAYVMSMIAQFQGFARDLHDVALETLVSAAGASAQLLVILVEAASGNRALDRGNPTVENIRTDFKRLGLTPLAVGLYDERWDRGDKALIGALVRLRNAVAHGDEEQLRALRDEGIRDTVGWARAGVPALNRFARALDKLVWDHLRRVTGREPWR